jgi:CrcB protein
MPTRWTSLLVALGGGLGSLARFGVDRLLPAFDAAAPLFPWATFAVNLLGSFLLGAVMAIAERRGDRSAWLLPLLGIGFCGSFTTLSMVSVECVHMLEGPHALLAAIYLAASFAGGVMLAWLGTRLGRTPRPPRESDGAPGSSNPPPPRRASP